MQHTKSPPSLLPELKLLTICTEGQEHADARWPPAENVPERGPRTDLALHVHDDHRVGAVAHHEVLRVLGQQQDVVDRDVGAGRRAQRFESVGALGGLHVPNLVPEHTHTHTRQAPWG